MDEKMTAYDSLNRVRRGWVEYKRLLNKVEHLTEISQRATPVLSGMPKTTARHGATDDPWAALADYKTECEEKLAYYLRQCMDLEKELEHIRSERVRTAMRYRYIDLCTISTIAEYMSMDTRNVQKLLRRGRTLYEEYYEEWTK